VRLDPNVKTSVQHTFFMRGDYLRAAAEAERTWAPGSTWSLSLACAGHPDAHRVFEIEWERYANTPFRDKVLGMIEPDRAPLRQAVDALIASGFRDPEGLFYQAIKLAHAGDCDRAVEILADVVDRGFYAYETFTRHAWLVPLRSRKDFAALLETARQRSEEAHAAFVNAGGKTLLGVEGDSDRGQER
jgi:hypothetical protein